jgi:hypothetical protein
VFDDTTARPTAVDATRLLAHIRSLPDRQLLALLADLPWPRLDALLDAINEPPPVSARAGSSDGLPPTVISLSTPPTTAPGPASNRPWRSWGAQFFYGLDGTTAPLSIMRWPGATSGGPLRLGRVRHAAEPAPPERTSDGLHPCLLGVQENREPWTATNSCWPPPDNRTPLIIFPGFR